jgi:DNA-binding NarL/FixJ family response regulator
MAFPIAIAGRIHADAGRVADAERLLLRALELLDAIAFIFPSADTWIRTVIAQGWLAIGDLTRARTTLAEARRLLQRHTFDPRVNMAVSRLEQGLHPTAAGVVQPLTERELEILRMLAAVQSLNQIAEHLVISVNTVKTHVRSIYRKLKVPNRQGALVRARDLGLLADSRVGDQAG